MEISDAATLRAWNKIVSAGYDILADGIAIDETSDHPVIIGDAQDPEFFAAIFRDNNSAIPNMRAADLERLRRFIIHGEGELPMPPARMRHSESPVEIVTSHKSGYA
jgi:hypothetical protein